MRTNRNQTRDLREESAIKVGVRAKKAQCWWILVWLESKINAVENLRLPSKQAVNVMEVGKEEELSEEGQQTVVKSNRMVKAKTPFTKLEHRVVASLISQIDRDQESFGTQRVSLRRIIERAEVSSTEIFRKAREICDRLVEKSVGICTYDEERGRVYTAYTLFRRCRYVEQEGMIEAKFEEEMRPLLLQLKNRFTMYSLNCFLRLPSRHSMRVYELLKMREDLGAMRISVEEFRETLGLENSYDRFTDLRRHVIEKARKQVSKHTDIRFTYRVERDGRTAEGLRFFVSRGEGASRGEEAGRGGKGSSGGEGSSGGKGSGGEPDGRGVESGSAGTAAPAPQMDINADTGAETSLRFDAKTWFLKGLTQEEIRSLSDETLGALHEAAQEAARRRHPNAKKSVLATETLRQMEKKWESGQPASGE